MNDSNVRKAALKLPVDFRKTFIDAFHSCGIMDLDYGADPATYFSIFSSKMRDQTKEIKDLNEKINNAKKILDVK